MKSEAILTEACVRASRPAGKRAVDGSAGEPNPPEARHGSSLKGGRAWRTMLGGQV